MLNCSPEEMVRDAIHRSAEDLCVAFKIKHIGPDASGIIDIATTTGDMTFKVGAVGSEAADTTVGPTLAVPGTINLSSEAATFALIQTIVDASANWEFIPDSALPGDASEASGTSKIINNITGGNCSVAAGYEVLIDTSAVLYHSVGVTNQGPSSEPHGSDASVYHEITQIRFKTTYSSGNSIAYLYEVDDIAQTSTLRYTINGAATTVEKVFADDGSVYPFLTSIGKRLVAKVINSAAMTAAEMTVYYGTKVFGPSARKNKLMSAY